MSFTNINDPAGVKALLERLRSSQAWQDISQAPPPASSSATAGAPAALPSYAARDSSRLVGSEAFVNEALASQDSATDAGQPPSSPPSVAALLSQLQASSSFNAVVAPAQPQLPLPPVQPCHAQPVGDYQPACGYEPARAPHQVTREPSPSVPMCAPSSAHIQDLRSCTFHQALPHLARLSEDPDFVKSISAMSDEQANLERRLWEERRDILRTYEDKVNAARTKAKIIGVGLTQHEADMMSDSLRKELQQFDSSRVIPAWDGLLAKQQSMLESLGVPTMFPTTVATDRERQQRVMQVLGGIVASDGA